VRISRSRGCSETRPALPARLLDQVRAKMRPRSPTLQDRAFTVPALLSAGDPTTPTTFNSDIIDIRMRRASSAPGTSVNAPPSRKSSPTDPTSPGAEFRKIQRVSSSRSGNPKKSVEVFNQELTVLGTRPVPSRIVCIENRGHRDQARSRSIDCPSLCWSLCPCRFSGHC